MSYYYNPVEIIKTNDWIFELNKQIDRLNIANSIVVTSSGNQKRLSLDKKFNSKNIDLELSTNDFFPLVLNSNAKYILIKRFEANVRKRIGDRWKELD